MKLLVFHSPEGAKAMHQLNGMITVQLFPFGNTDTWRWNLGLAKLIHCVCHCVRICLYMHSVMEFVYLLLTFLKRKDMQNFKFDCFLNAEFFFFFWLASFSANKIDSLPWCMFITVWVITTKTIIKMDYAYSWHLALVRSGVLIYEYLEV